MSYERSREHLSIRLPRPTLVRLDERASDTGQTRSALAARYLEEGLRSDEHPGIVFVDGPAGRRPRLAPAGPDVWEVIETLRASANSIEETAEYLAIPLESVRAAVAYYAAYPDEINAWIERNLRIADREEEAWRRQARLLA